MAKRVVPLVSLFSIIFSIILLLIIILFNGSMLAGIMQAITTFIRNFITEPINLIILAFCFVVFLRFFLESRY